MVSKFLFIDVCCRILSCIFFFLKLIQKSAWLISYNFKYAYYVATFFNALGGWIRYAAFKNMPIAIIGEILIGVG